MSEICIPLEDILSSAQSMNPVDYQYYNSLAKRRIILNEEICENLVEKVILPLIDMDNDGSGEPIEIILNSPGGSPLDGMCLVNIIDKLKTPTTLKVLGYAYSMCAILLCSGRHNPNVKKVCYEFTTALIHDGESFVSGGAGQVKDTQRFLEKLNDRIKGYIIANTNITEELFDKMERKEWYLDASEMKELLIIDEIL